LTGCCPADDAVSHVPPSSVLLSRAQTAGGDREQQRPMVSDRAGWAHTWGWLRSRGARGLRLVVPAPGDPLGLPGPAATNRLAMTAGVALVSVAGDPVVLVAEEPGLWRAHPALDDALAAAQLGTRSEVRRAMRESMAVVTAALEDHEMQPDAEALAAIEEMRRFSLPTPPSSVDPEDVALVASALRVWQLTLIAGRLADRMNRSPDPALLEVARWSRRAVAVGFSANSDRHR